MLKVADAMTADPRTRSPDSTVAEAVPVMRDADCGTVPVTEAGWSVGVVTDRDIAMALPEHEADLARLPVGELMTTDLVTVGRDEPLTSAMDKRP